MIPNSNLYHAVDRQISELRDGYPWQSLKNGKVVDIGGGTGHISMGVARVCGEIPLFSCQLYHHTKP